MIKFVAFIGGIDLERKLELLLDAAKVAGVPMELGVVPLPVKPLRRKYPRKGRSTKAGKKKRYPGKLAVRIGPVPASVPPKTLEVYNVLKREYGTRVFEKRLAKGVVIASGMKSGATGHITRLMDHQGLVPA